MSDQPSEEDAVAINPFVLINRGEDSVIGKGNNERVVFSDFSPKVLPADVPEEVTTVLPEEVGDPKDLSAPEGADSEPSTPTPTEPTSSENPVPNPADSEGGQKETENGSPTSSSDQKSG